MKEEINLLSPEAKRIRLQRLYRKRLAYLARRIMFIWVIFLVVMLSSFWYVWQRTGTVDRELVAHQVDKGSILNQVRSINSLMAVVGSWVDDHPTWTPLVSDVFRVIPVSVRLEVLTVQPDESGLLVRGVSSSRAAVVEMQQAFEKLPWVKQVEAPLQNFAAGGTNEFSFTLVRNSHEDASKK